MLGQPVWPNPKRVQSGSACSCSRRALRATSPRPSCSSSSRASTACPLDGRADRLLGAGRARRRRPRRRRASSRAASSSASRSRSRSCTTPRSCSSTSRRRASTRRRAATSGRSSARSAAENRTVVLTTHYLEEAETLCDRVAIMDGGAHHRARLAAARSIAASRPRSRVVFEGRRARRGAARRARRRDACRAPRAALRADIDAMPQHDAARRCSTWPRSAGVALRRPRRRQPTLEDVFLEATGTEFRE